MDNPSGGGGGGEPDTETFSAAVSTDDKRNSDKNGDDLEMIPLPSLGSHAKSK